MAPTRKNADKAQNNTTKKKRNLNLLNDVRYGRALSIDFFRQNAWLLLAIIVAIISLIGLRYKTKTKMSIIKELNKELEMAKSEKLKEKADYMTLIRESEMKRLVTEKGLGLEFREQPPYEIDIESQDSGAQSNVDNDNSDNTDSSKQ